MTQSVAILGRQPALGIAELESLYGSAKLKPIAKQAVLLDLNPAAIQFNRLGGTVKLAKLLTTLSTSDWKSLQSWLYETVPDHLQYLPEGKLQVGLSVYGLGVSTARLNATGLALKKVIRSHGRSVRLIPNKTLELNSAQVLHNNLTGPLGWELLFVREGKHVHVAQTVAVQDIEAYAGRDQARPKRDARVGMLPPKLAQIIINLAIGQKEQGARSKEQDFKDSSLKVLDPFCGTGVLIQEAALMGYEGYGADIDPRMGEYYQENMQWLYRKYPRVKSGAWQLADATKATWETSEFSPDMRDAWRVPLKFDTIATETYLGRPFSAQPKSEVLKEVMNDVDTIHRKFLQNVARQTQPGFRMCLAIPAWSISRLSLEMRGGFVHLPTLDHLTDLGYNRVSFVHAKNDDLIYHREGQVVGRELVVLTRV